ncbi:MAG TPA: imidazole glycerol phosphate synthase subunit HisH [Burkholderiales bacterium]|nr:imidazole glycerol phosphate synthase subunit HisH [Burkholderiales bacterium]
MTDIAVVDYGMGNLRSVAKALECVAPERRVRVTSLPEEVLAADRVVFPGQGAMPDCIRELDDRGLREAVLKSAHSKPFLGICIGLQMLFERSEEGEVAGLGVLPGQVVRFDKSVMRGDHLKVPHMGWNEVRQAKAHPLWAGIDDGVRFYFVHSYYVETSDRDLVVGETMYPSAFTSCVAQDNIFAAQFHPEKSHKAGLKLLSNFVSWNP